MKHCIKSTPFFILIIAAWSFQSCKKEIPDNWQWETITTKGQPTARHEAGFVAYKSKLYLMGGRRINPTSEFDPATNTWTDLSTSGFWRCNLYNWSDDWAMAK